MSRMSYSFVGTVTLLETMAKFKVFHLIFSSSATVYGDPQRLPIHESDKVRLLHPVASLFKNRNIGIVRH